MDNKKNINTIDSAQKHKIQHSVFLIRNVAPEKFGGGETYQLKLAAELKSHGFSPAILTNSKELLARAKSEGIKTYLPPYIENQIWSGLKNFLLPAYFVKLKAQQRWYEALFKRERPSVINVQSRDDWLSATLAARCVGNIKILWTDHADFRNWVLWNLDKPLKNPIGKKIAKLSRIIDKLIFISQYEKNWFTSFPQTKHQKNLVIVPNGVKDEFEKYRNIKSEKNSFIYLGRIVEEKGISTLLKAFKKVSKEFSDARLNLYGDGPDLARYCVETKAFKNIHFHGETANPIESLAKNQIFVLPSYREGLSLSLLEAAMMQKTIIATNIDGNPEVVEDKKSGLLVPPKDPAALAAAMQKLLKDPNLAKSLARNARQTYEEHFDLDRIFDEQMLPLYNNDK